MADPLTSNEIQRKCKITLNYDLPNGELPQVFEGLLFTSHVNRLSDILNDDRVFVPIKYNGELHLVNKNMIASIKQT